jgi:hypothetical protein
VEKETISSGIVHYSSVSRLKKAFLSGEVMLECTQEERVALLDALTCQRPPDAGEIPRTYTVKETQDMKAFAFTNTKGNTYYLHARVTTLKNGQQQTIYFFAKEVKDGALEKVPDGYEPSESKNGLPVLKKKA